MPAFKRNQPRAEKRRVTLFVYDIDGNPIPATTTFSAAGELLVDKGTGTYVAASGTLSNTTRPATISDTIDSLNTSTNIITAAAHGLSSGDGPIQFSTSGTLPGGITALTDYYVGVLSANTFQIYPTRADALALTNVIDITSAGTGTHTLTGISSTRLNDGNFVYEATQSELNYHGDYFGIRISKPGVARDLVHNVDLEDSDFIHEGAVASTPSSTQVTLDALASSLNDFYNGAVIVIIAGTGIGQFRTILDYTGASKIADLDRAWTTNPDTTSRFVILAAVANANTSTIAAAVWNVVGEGVYTYGDLMRGIISLNGGTVTDFQTGVLQFKSLNGAKTRWTMNCDTSGRLSITVGDLTI